MLGATQRSSPAALLFFLLAACSAPGPSTPAEPSAAAGIRPEDILGRWGYAAYYNEKDRPRIEVAARAQCKQPAVIKSGPNGGVVMPIANQTPGREQVIKSGPQGRNYIGPPGDPGGADDSEIITFDGKLLITRTVAADEGGHLTSIYVRCKT